MKQEFLKMGAGKIGQDFKIYILFETTLHQKQFFLQSIK